MTLDNLLQLIEHMGININEDYTIQRHEYEIFILNIILGIKMLQNDEQMVCSIFWQLLVE